jgi:hypothetical protein
MGLWTFKLPGGYPVDLTSPSNNQVLTFDSATNTWKAAAAGAGANHNLLDGSVDQDTVAYTVVRGSIIRGDSTPKWNGLAIGAANKVLHSDGTDATWQSLVAADIPTSLNVIGKQDTWVPAVADWVTTTSGATAVAKTETATNLLNYQAISFINGATNRAEFMWTPPRNWDFSTIKLTFYWLSTNASTNSVTWRASGVALANAAAIDQAQGTQQTVAQANGGASFLNISAQTPAITVGGTPASTKPVQIRLERQTGDTLAFPALLLGVVIEYSITQATAA